MCDASHGRKYIFEPYPRSLRWEYIDVSFAVRRDISPLASSFCFFWGVESEERFGIRSEVTRSSSFLLPSSYSQQKLLHLVGFALSHIPAEMGLSEYNGIYCGDDQTASKESRNPSCSQANIFLSASSLACFVFISSYSTSKFLQTEKNAAMPTTRDVPVLK